MLGRLNEDSKASNAHSSRNRGEWARMMAAEIKKQGTARTQNIALAIGEAVLPGTEQFLHDAFIPDLAGGEAFFDCVGSCCSVGLDASLSIQATNSLEKMLAHQMAAAHKVAMEQIGQASCERNAVLQAKKLHAATRCMALYQQGLLPFTKSGKTDNESRCSMSMSAMAVGPSSQMLSESRLTASITQLLDVPR